MARRLLVTILSLWAGIACNPSAPAEPGEARRAPIVNGQLEPGWPAVGALIIDEPSAGNLGAVSTGTLARSPQI